MKTLLIVLMLIAKMQTARNDAVLQGDFQSMKFALESYKVNAQSYPSTEQGLKALVDKPGIAPRPRRWTQIMDKVPVDPWGREYHYKLVDGKVQLWSKGGRINRPQ